jgi:hypothetical protein
MKNKTQIQPKDCLFQIKSNNFRKEVDTTIIGSEMDVIFAIGVAFENDPDIYYLFKKALNLYDNFKNECNE